MDTLLQYCTPRIYPVLLLFYSKRNEKLEICCVPHASTRRVVAGAEIRGPNCHKHCGLGSNPVINGVARQ